MQIVCTNPNGYRLHLDDHRDGNEIVLHHGVNEVDDAFGAEWFALHRDGAHVLPMVTDGSIFQLMPAEPVKVAKAKKGGE